MNLTIELATDGLESAKSILTTAGEKLLEGWVQGFSAVDDWGKECSPWDPEASKWCATGAVDWAVQHNDAGVEMEDEVHDTVLALLDDVAFREDSSVSFMSQYNDADGRKVEEVLKLYDVASDELEAAITLG